MNHRTDGPGSANTSGLPEARSFRMTLDRAAGGTLLLRFEGAFDLDAARRVVEALEHVHAREIELDFFRSQEVHDAALPRLVDGLQRFGMRVAVVGLDRHHTQVLHLLLGTQRARGREGAAADVHA